MNWNDWESYLEHLKEERKTDREREIDKELLVIADKYRKALVAESAPLYEELAQIEMLKPPLPIQIDGKIFEYVGPGYGRR